MQPLDAMSEFHTIHGQRIFIFQTKLISSGFFFLRTNLLALTYNVGYAEPCKLFEATAIWNKKDTHLQHLDNCGEYVKERSWK